MQIPAAIVIFHNLREAKKVKLTVGELTDILRELKDAGLVREFKFGDNLDSELLEPNRCICTVQFPYNLAEKQYQYWEHRRDLPLFGRQLCSEELTREWLLLLLVRSLQSRQGDKDCPAIGRIQSLLRPEEEFPQQQPKWETAVERLVPKDWLRRRHQRRKYRHAGRHGRRRDLRKRFRHLLSQPSPRSYRGNIRATARFERYLLWATLVAALLAAAKAIFV